MKKEEAIVIIDSLNPGVIIKTSASDEKIKEAIGMAVKALQKEPVSEQKLSNVERTVKDWKEEPVSDDFTIALAECISQAQVRVVDPLVLAETWKDELIKLAKSEEPVSEDLTEAAIEAFKQIVDSDKNNFLEIFKAGAKWQKTKDESTTEDLGEYINELSKQFPEVSFAKLSRIAVRVVKWQKEHIMAKAIYGTARPDDNEIWCNLASSNLKDGDKVKVIVIKED